MTSGSSRFVAVVVTVVALVAGCGSKTTTSTGSSTPATHASPSSSTTTAPVAPPKVWVGPDCGKASAPDLPAAFGSLPRKYIVKPICLADVGPGLAGPQFATQFSDMAAGEVTETDVTIGTGPPGVLVLRVFVGKLQTGNGAAFVDTFISQLGPDAGLGTVEGAGHVMRYISISGGPEGYAYGEDQTVVIGYIRNPNEIEPKHPEFVELPARDAFMRILAAAIGAPLDPNKQPPGGNYPLARGNYTTPDDPGWIFFKTEAGQSCGISPDGTLAGCDNVSAEAPAGTNQTVVRGSQPAAYIHSDTPTFTRSGIDILPAGRRLDNGAATCSVGHQGTVGCKIGGHQFTIASQYGELN
jgi:hypothetical protein